MFNRARLVLAAWFSIALVATLVVVGGTAYVLIRRDIDREIDESLEATQALLQEPEPIRTDRSGPGDRPRGDFPVLVPDPSIDLRRLPPGIPSDVFVVYTDGAGEVSANPRNVDVDDLNFGSLCDEATSAANARATTDLSANGGSYRIVTVKAQEEGVWVHIGRSLEARDRQLRTLTSVFIVGGVGGVALSVAGGLWLAGLAPGIRSNASAASSPMLRMSCGRRSL
jgi:hypothetical protein